MLMPRSLGVCRATTSERFPLASNVVSTWTLPQRLLYTAPSTPVSAAAAARVVGARVSGVGVAGAWSACPLLACAAVVDGPADVVGATVPAPADAELVRTIPAAPEVSEPAPAVLPVANSATRPAVEAT